MKNVVLMILSMYKTILSPLLHSLLGVRSACLFEESCSAYAQRMITTEGISRGLLLSIRRVLSCQRIINYGKFV